MATQTTPTAGLTLDIKKRRFRITSRTFQIIDTPAYFRFLVNPGSRGLVIEECSESTKGAYELSKVPQHRGCYELTSKSLMNELIQCAGITGTDTIRLEGQRIKGQNALFFRLVQIPERMPSVLPEKEAKHG